MSWWEKLVAEAAHLQHLKNPESRSWNRVSYSAKMKRIEGGNICAWTSTLLVLCALSFFPQLSYGGRTYCQTSDRSPNEADAAKGIQYIRDLGYVQCCNNNCAGSKCTTMHVEGEAAVSICGVCTLGACMACRDAAEYLEMVHGSCAQDVGGVTRVGGFYSLDGVDQQLSVIAAVDA